MYAVESKNTMTKRVAGCTSEDLRAEVLAD